MRFKPRPYQAAAVESVVAQFRTGTQAVLLHLPTGAGKTVVATLLLERLLRERPQRTLFVAHRREILDQIARTVSAHLPRLRVETEQGARRASPDADVVVASVQSLVKRKERYDPAAFELIVLDECHRALAPTWTEVLRYFRQHQTSRGRLVGMTATPRRTDGRSATELFDAVAFSIGREELQTLGHLVPLRYFAVQTELGLERVKVSAGDFQVGALSKVMDSAPVRAITVKAWLQKGRGRKTIVFCAGVGHAERLAADIAAASPGTRAAHIHGRSDNRAALIEAFKTGALDVLTNYGVLTEGFDEPTIGCVLMARPTRSPLVYTQCVGRGLRPSPGKRDCVLIDITDRSKNPLQYGAAEMAGLPRRGWRSHGHDPEREARALRGISVTDPNAFVRIQQATCLADVHAILMELPPATVMAGLDGQPVLHYQRPGLTPSDARAIEFAKNLLRESGARWRQVRATRHLLEVSLAEPETANARFDYLLWHLERITHRPARFTPPNSRVRPPRAVLRDLLRAGLELRQFKTQDHHATATVLGLRPGEGAWLQQAFAGETGLTIDLTGQLAFEF